MQFVDLQTFQTEKCERVTTVQLFDTGGRCEDIPKNVKLNSFKDASLLWPQNVNVFIKAI